MLDRPDHNRRAALRRLRDLRHRARVKAHRAVYQIEIGGEVLDLLLRARWITERELLDRKAVEAAIGAMLAASARV